MAVPSTVSVPMVSLYVGDLHPDVTDDLLSEAFSDFKTLSSVRVCREPSTGRSLCYGYVNFVTQEDASRAIELKNNTELNGKVMRVTWSHRDPDARRSGIGNVFVKNLNDSVDNVALREPFQNFGNIISCKVVSTDDGKSKGYGFVQYETEESAKAAIENLNGLTLEGKQIYVAKFVKRSDRVLPNPDSKFTNLYMKNLDLDVTENHMHEKFSKFGKVASLIIVRDDNGISRGFGFVSFENPDDAKLAVETMHGSQLGSKKLYVARAQKKEEREQILHRQFEEKRKEQIIKYQGSNVYVKNIDDAVSDDELKGLFGNCGAITSAKLMRDDKGISKGFGFVCFSCPEEACKAVNTYQGYMFHNKPLYVAIAQKKEDRKVQLQMQYAQRLVSLMGGPGSAVIPGGYSPFYYTSPHGVTPQLATRPGMMYQSLGVRPGWRPTGFAHPVVRPAFQPSPALVVNNYPRQNRQKNRSDGRVNGQMHPQNGGSSVSYRPKTPTQSATPVTDSSNQQHSEPAMLAAASPDQQKQIIGERLYLLVKPHKPDLCSKITGMLLEMDNAELIAMMESPELLAAKVEEAVEVLQHSKTKVPSNQESIHPSFLSTGVAVN